MITLMPIAALPTLPVVGVYVAAALLPALLLMGYIYFQDAVEKEPAPLLLSLGALGALAALIALGLEGLGQRLIDTLVRPGTALHTLLIAFLVVAAVEEGAKLFLLRRRTWDEPNFNYSFDAVVYAVFVSLGFGAFENLRYVFTFGLAVALPRAVLAIPGHMGFAVVMGVFYGRARLKTGRGQTGWPSLLLAYLLPVVLHGIYDACCMLGTAWATLLFALFVCALYLSVYRLIRTQADADVPV